MSMYHTVLLDSYLVSDSHRSNTCTL